MEKTHPSMVCDAVFPDKMNFIRETSQNLMTVIIIVCFWCLDSYPLRSNRNKFLFPARSTLESKSNSIVHSNQVNRYNTFMGKFSQLIAIVVENWMGVDTATGYIHNHRI